MSNEETGPSISWQDIPNDGSLHGFAAVNHLDLDALRLGSQEVMLLPCNRESGEEMNEQNLFVGSTKEILIALHEGGVESKLYKDKRENVELVRRSADIITPILLFLNSPAGAVALNILASWIYDNFLRIKDAFKPSLRVEYAEVSANGNLKWRRIEGRADDVHRLVLEEARQISERGNIQLSTSSTASVESLQVPTDTPYERSRAQTALAVADGLIREAQDALSNNDVDIAERLYRRGLGKIREAVLWEPNVDSHRRRLHQVGMVVHDNFGCTIEFEGGSYWNTCPVLLSHVQGGFSVGGSAKGICSICGGDMMNCSHVKGRVYNHVIATRRDGVCNICTQRDCEHIEGQLYDGVRAFQWITELKPTHVSLVQHPADPMSTFFRISIPEAELVNSLPAEERPHFIYGESVIHCHHCQVCTGTEPDSHNP